MKTLTFRSKLIIGFLMAVIPALVLTGVDVYSVNRGNDALAYVYQNRVQPIAALQEMDSHLKEIRFRMAGVLLDQMPAAGSRNHIKEVRGKILEDWDSFKNATDAYINSDVSKSQIAKINERIALLPAFLDKLDGAYATDDKSKITPMLEDEWPAFHSGLIKPISILLQQQQQAIEQTYDGSKVSGHRLIFVGISVLGISLLIAIIVIFMVIRSINNQLGGEPEFAKKIAGKVAEGDLTVAIETKPEDRSSLLYAMKHMSENLINIVSEVRHSTESIRSASQEVAQGNIDLSSRTEQQASSLEETASNMQELLAAVKRNTENARQAYQLVQGTCEVADQSGKAVGVLVATMNSINDSSRQIEDIISVIDGIAFQTNILALNAAVEAARAGELGRGFAVVAGEVRNLAQRSAIAAKEIKRLIENSVEKVNVGSRQVKDSSEVIDDVVTSVQLVASMMKDISRESGEQSMSIEQVNVAITQLDAVTQQNSALVEQSAAAAQSMREQADALMQAVSIFRLEAGRVEGQKTKETAIKPMEPVRQNVVQLRKEQLSAAGARKLAVAGSGRDDDWSEF